MFSIILYLAIGILYGLVWYFIQMRGIAYFISLFQNHIKFDNEFSKARSLSIVSTIISIFLGGAFLVTVIFLKPYVGDWRSFVTSWVLGLCLGVFIIRKSTTKNKE